jgi:4-amino-4-deoxy-L-arabinose transferase-like glycosyltransferase
LETRVRFACGTFVAVLLSLFLLEGSRVVFTNDEGIILEAAQRMVRGERLYVDFFGYMSPGGYWLQSTAFRLFGINLPAARAVVFTDFALQSAVIAWLVARFASRRAAIAAVFIFVGLHIPQPGLLTAQHRWVRHWPSCPRP